MYVPHSARGVVADPLVAQFSSWARLKDEWVGVRAGARVKLTLTQTHTLTLTLTLSTDFKILNNKSLYTIHTSNVKRDGPGNNTQP